jgi:hypothetical protein
MIAKGCIVFDDSGHGYQRILVGELEQPSKVGVAHSFP